MRRAGLSFALFVPFAFAACARHPPDAVTAVPALEEPLVVGRSPNRAREAEPMDAGAVLDTWMTGVPDAAVARTGCQIEAKGSPNAAAVSLDVACAVEQEYDRHTFDSGGAPVVKIWDSLPTSPGVAVVRLAIFRQTTPAVGVQPSTSFIGHARIMLDTQTWVASNTPPFRNLIPAAATAALSWSWGLAPDRVDGRRRFDILNSR